MGGTGEMICEGRKKGEEKKKGAKGKIGISMQLRVFWHSKKYNRLPKNVKKGGERREL